MYEVSQVWPLIFVIMYEIPGGRISSWLVLFTVKRYETWPNLSLQKPAWKHWQDGGMCAQYFICIQSMQCWDSLYSFSDDLNATSVEYTSLREKCQLPVNDVCNIVIFRYLWLLVVKKDEEAWDGGGGGGWGGDALHCAAAQTQVWTGQWSQEEVLSLQVLHSPQTPVSEFDQRAGHKVREQPRERVGRGRGGGGGRVLRGRQSRSFYCFLFHGGVWAVWVGDREGISRCRKSGNVCWFVQQIISGLMWRMR